MRSGLVLAAGAALVLLIGCTESPQMAREAAEPDHPFPVLDAYGAWIDYPALGRVWQPRVAYDWRPFSDGQWIWTDRGWFWDSPEPFGWIVYHYGFWTYQSAAGWLWVPGYEWSPARVRWYEDETMIGWAPLPPAGFEPQAAEFGWITIQPQYFVRENVGHYAERARQLPATRKVGEERRQPDVRTIERAAARRIEKLTTESETVRSGQKQVQRVKIGQRAPEPRAPAPPPGATGSRPGDRTPEMKKELEKEQVKPSIVQPNKGGRAGDRVHDLKKDSEKTQPGPPGVQPEKKEKKSDRAPEPPKEKEKSPKKPPPEEK
jgi:hypothetical protein